MRPGKACIPFRFLTRDVAYPRRTLRSEITVLRVTLDNKDGIVGCHILHLHLGLVGIEIFDWNVKSEGDIPRDVATVTTRRFETNFGPESKNDREQFEVNSSLDARGT